MRFVPFPAPARGGAAELSELGFGCAAIMGRVGRADSLAALSAAADAGINFFDTARSYGYGESETLLGTFLKGRRQSAVLCTKFGILPPPRGGWKQRIKPLAQAAIQAFPSLRARARRAAAGQVVGGQFSLGVLRASFETSLRELQTDYVDMLLLHGATLEVLDQGDLLEALERLVESGKVRMAGISGDHAVIAETFRRQPAALTTAQFALNLESMSFVAETASPSAQKLLLVANHPFGGPAGVDATAASIAAMLTSDTLPPTLREKLLPNDPQLMPEMVLNAILRGTGISAVVPAMMRPASLAGNVRAVEECRFTPEELSLLRQEWLRQQWPGGRQAAAQAPSA